MMQTSARAYALVPRAAVSECPRAFAKLEICHPLRHQLIAILCGGDLRQNKQERNRFTFWTHVLAQKRVQIKLLYFKSPIL